MAVGVLPLTFPAACSGFLVRAQDLVGHPPSGCDDRGRAGQAAGRGRPQAGVNRVIHSCPQCQASGRRSAIWPWPCRAVRAATPMRSRWIVASQAWLMARLARDPAAHSRQQVVRDGRAGQPGRVGGEDPYGRCASGSAARSAKTCSMIVWSRCWPSAWTSSNGESANTAW